ncbi:MAG: Lrp/AsnC family transcriptional regulator [Lachnospiraceae bacterium]|nr:Lrp/AsnC family transcriptional regulator [Lachnospiraceae bacterium]
MDGVDYKILKILQKNARETASNIGKQIHLSVSAVIERIRKMEETGLIREYTIIVDEKRTGNTMTALMEVSLEHPRHFETFSEAIQEMDSIVSCYYQTGDFDLLLKLVCSSSDELEEIHRQLMSLEGVSDTRTHVVLKCVKNSYSAIPNPAFLHSAQEQEKPKSHKRHEEAEE